MLLTHMLKKDTAVTISVVKSAERLLTLNREKEIHLQQLMAQMRQSYTRMFGSVQRYRLTAMKNEKLWAQMRQSYTRMFRSVQRYRLTAMKNEKVCAMFHMFSIEEGFEM